MAKNAAEVSALGADLHKRFTKFLDHFAKIGKGLGSAVSSYEDALGSMNRMVLPAARKFTKLHSANQSGDIADLVSMEKSAAHLLIANSDDEEDLTDKKLHG